MAGGPITDPTVEAEAALQAPGPEVARGAALIAVEPGPAREANALSEHRVTAGGAHSEPQCSHYGALTVLGRGFANRRAQSTCPRQGLKCSWSCSQHLAGWVRVQGDIAGGKGSRGG